MQKVKKSKNWVYTQCANCGKKRDIAMPVFLKKTETITEEEYLKTILCKECKKQNSPTNGT